MAKAVEVGAEDIGVEADTFEKLLFGGKSVDEGILGVLRLRFTREGEVIESQTGKGMFSQGTGTMYLSSNADPSSALHEFFHALRPHLHHSWDL